MRIKEALRLYITVSRWEFLPAVFIGIFIGILIGADSLPYLLSWGFWPYLLEGLLIFIVLFNVGFMVNCWADWKVDELYKTALYQAVVRLGRNKLGILVVLHIILAVMLAIHLSIMLQRIEIISLVSLGTILGVAYSIEPFRFKKRGVLHSIVALPIFFIPGVYSYFLVTGRSLFHPYTLSFLLLATGITIAHYALILVSQAEDTPADRALHLHTPAVTWGVKRTIHISVLLGLLGSVISTLSLILLFLYVNVWLLLFTPLILIGRYYAMKEIYKLHKQSAQLPSEHQFLEQLRKKMVAYPLWHAYGLLGLTISSLAIFIVKTVGWMHPILI